ARQTRRWAADQDRGSSVRPPARRADAPGPPRIGSQGNPCSQAFEAALGDHPASLGPQLVGRHPLDFAQLLKESAASFVCCDRGAHRRPPSGLMEGSIVGENPPVKGKVGENSLSRNYAIS